MNDSILTSIKKLLGIAEECEDFDTDIIIHINSTFSNLYQIGVGSERGFSIVDKYTAWKDYISTDNASDYQAIKTYIYLKVKLLFDPPLSSSAVEAINRSISELEWRLNILAESDKTEKEV